MTEPITLNIFLSLTISFAAVYFIIPFIIRIARVKKLFDIPNSRSATRQVIPTLGGIAIFFGFFISVILSSGSININELKYLFVATFVMFALGLYDDLLGSAAVRKLIIELALAIGLVLLGNYQFSDLHGLFGIHEIGYVMGSILSVVTIVGIINALNLIDGIDGLASGTGILISFTYGLWFLFAGDYLYAVSSFSLTGSLAAFFLYNVFGIRNKLFMGDTGSLIIGSMLAIFTIRFNEFVSLNSAVETGQPAISLAIMIVPVIDTLRVFTIRIMNKRSPFSPDMNHVHHLLLRLGNSHLKSSLIIISINGGAILLALSLIHVLGNNVLFLVLLGLGFLIANIPLKLVKYKESNALKVNKSDQIQSI